MKAVKVDHGQTFRFCETDLVQQQCAGAPHPEEVARGEWKKVIEPFGNHKRHYAVPANGQAHLWHNLLLPVELQAEVELV